MSLGEVYTVQRHDAEDANSEILLVLGNGYVDYLHYIAEVLLSLPTRTA